MNKILNTDEFRFMSMITVMDNGCWRISRFTKAPKSYSEITLNDKRIHAHRASYMVFNGPLIEGLVIDHMCMNRYCINPDHLRQVTQKVNTNENTRRVISPYCPSGHEFTPENTLYKIDREGIRCRSCRACNKIRCRERYYKSKETKCA